MYIVLLLSSCVHEFLIHHGQNIEKLFFFAFFDISLTFRSIVDANNLYKPIAHIYTDLMRMHTFCASQQSDLLYMHYIQVYYSYKQLMQIYGRDN